MLSLGNGVSYENNGSRVLFDPSRKAREGLVCISHGHSDHAKNHDTTMLMTQETMEITGLEGEAIKYGKEKHGITAHNAGHVLGSAQFETNGIVYTGDLLTDNPLLGGADPVPCEELVIEATFGLPEYVFRPREEVIAEIQSWVKANHDAGRTVVLGGYSLGKAQELTKIACGAGFTPLVHPKIARVNEVYESHGVRLGEWVETGTDEGNEMARHSYVAVMPFHQVKPPLIESLSHDRKVVAGVATGWSFGNKAGKVFQLSDHADFPHLLRYVEAAEPKRIYTVHGFESEFARQLQRRGWAARPLKHRQKTLGEW
ncbi:MBL fold metallo-hydrolase RNA specificity domain-containing protein [archaeon]